MNDWLNDLLQNDPDPSESREWIESIKAVIDHDGPERAHQLLSGMVELTRRAGAHLPFAPTTEYINTIPPQLEPKMLGDAQMEWKIRSIIRWNAMAMVVRANRKPGDLGGHIASFASSATLYDVGFNHFWRGPSAEHPGDLLYTQGYTIKGVQRLLRDSGTESTANPPAPETPIGREDLLAECLEELESIAARIRFITRGNSREF